MPKMLTPSVTTAEDLLALHEPGCRHELVRGELRRTSPAGYWHGLVIGRITGRLTRLAEERRLGGVFGAETGFLLARNPDTVRAPDVAFVRRNRLPAEFSPGFFPGPPDLAVEVTSPSDSYSSVHEKALCWLEHGALLVWVLDPVARRVTVYRSAGDIRVFGPDEELTGGDVVPGFAVPVSELFPSPMPATG